MVCALLFPEFAEQEEIHSSAFYFSYCFLCRVALLDLVFSFLLLPFLSPHRLVLLVKKLIDNPSKHREYLVVLCTGIIKIFINVANYRKKKSIELLKKHVWK